MLFVHYPSWIKPEIIPGLPIRWYALMYIFAFAATYVLMRHQIKKEKLRINNDDLSNYFFWGILGLLIGARVFSTLVYQGGHYLRRPWLIFWPFDADFRFTGLQGMSYHGGLIGAAAGFFLYCRRYKKNFLAWADLLSAGLPLGYTFGRLGNFINGELYGKVTDSRLGMLFPRAERFSSHQEWVRELAAKVGIEFQAGALINLPRHPSQLYEAFFEGIVLWAILWFIIRKIKKYDGQVLAWYLLGYGTFRFFIEYFRQPDKGLDYPIMLGSPDASIYQFGGWLNFSTGQILCAIMIVTGLILMPLFRHLHKKRHAQ